jgi:iron(III) transport system substrate-binding protein
MALIPDQGEGGLGTLAMPTTVALVAGRPPSAAAKKLVDYLLSKDVEQKLIAARFVKFSVRAGPGEIRTMDVDYAKAAAIFPQVTRRATALLEGRDDSK